MATNNAPRQSPRRVHRRFCLLLLCAAVLWGAVAWPADAAVRIASWNVKHLGWNNGKDLDAVADVIEHFHLVALQEVMTASAAEDVAALLSRDTGEPWGVLVSKAIGDSKYKESYAFLWRQSEVVHEGGTTVYLDPGNRFAREPLASRFRVTVDGRPLTLTMATVHIVYGDSKAERAAEIRELDEYWRWLGDTFDGQRILLGDFNMAPDDPSWSEFDIMAQPAITQGATTLGKTGYANLYDNIWTDGTLPITESGIDRYPERLGLEHDAARRRVSDHAPVYIVLGEVEEAAASELGGNPNEPCIDLNKASAAELDTLVHIGPSRAQAIIAGRRWHSLGELTRISGLSDARVRDIEGSGAVCPFSGG